MTIILKPLDQLGFPGYGITLSGAVWSRLDTHSLLTNNWEPKETRLKRGALYVRLQVDQSTVEVRLARLMIEATFGRLPDLKGFRIRHHNGDPLDCRLVNLTYAPKRRFSALTLKGAKFEGLTPPGFALVQV